MDGLPDGWIEKPLAEVIEPRGEKVSPQDFPSFKFIGMDHVESQTTKIIGSVPASSMKSNAARFYKNDVLYGRLRPYLNKVTQPSFDGLASAEFVVFPDTDLIKSDYLKYRLNAADFVSFASHLNEGDRPRVGFDQIGTFSIRVPPPKEQKRIVAKIEELFSELDKGIENLKTAREQLKVYRQAVLKHAFEGKLTANWREKNKDKLESADELLERIKHERQSAYEKQLEEWKAVVKQWEVDGKKGKRPTRTTKPKYLCDDEIEKYDPLPNGWGWTSFCNVTYKIGDIDHKMPKDSSEGYPYLSTGNLRPDGTIDFANAKIISTKDYQRLALKIKPEKGDIIFPRYGTIGRNFLIDFDREFLVSYSCAIVKNITMVMNEKYVFYYSLSPVVKKEIKKYVRETTQANIGIASIERFVFPLCSYNEQCVIAEMVESRFSAIEDFEKSIDEQLKQIEILRQSILSQAFAGKLVAQDPKDEPASVLLERIKAKRNDTQKRKKKVA